MSDDKAFQQCVQAFADKDYFGCAQQARTLQSAGKTHELAQLVLMSLQRMRQTGLFEACGTEYLTAASSNPWHTVLLKLTLGQTGPLQALALAKTDEQKCQAHFYAGAQLLAAGQDAMARMAFGACLATRVDCMESHLARVEKGGPAPAAAGSEAQQLVKRLNQQVEQLNQIGRPDEAFAVAIQACDLARKHLGESDAELARSVNNLGYLHSAAGNYAAAEPLHRQALQIRRAVLGEEHLDVAISLNNLATLYKATGNYATAEPLYRESVQIKRKALGEKHPSYAISLDNLAELYRVMGNYAAAEPLYRQAGEIFRLALGEDNPHYATCLNNLALLYQFMGNYAAAEPLFRQALEIRLAALGKDDPEVAQSLNNLGALLEATGSHAAAVPLFEHASDIYRTSLGENHPDFATILNNLAAAYDSLGDYAKAEPLYRQALEIDRQALGENHPEFATALNNLAALHHAMGNYTAAEPLYLQAINNARRSMGDNHPRYATGLRNLALLCVATDRTGEALSLMRQAAAIDDRMIGQVFSIGSESQRTAFINQVHTNLKALLSLVWQHFQEDRDAVRATMDLLLRRKAIGAESLAAQRDALLGGKYPELKSQVQEWAALRSQIAKRTLAGPASEGLSAHQQLLAQLDQQKERLEAELARSIPEMNLEKKLHAADRRAVALALPEGIALVEFVRFEVFDFRAVPARGQSRGQPARYLAFVLPAGEPDNVQMIDLGEAEPIDRMIRDFRAGITGEVENRAGRDLGAAPVEPARAPGSSHGPALRAAVFDKLLPALAGCKRLLLAPDGDLTRLPFEVLPTADGRRLIDEYTISYLSCGRDVLRFGAVSNRLPSEPLVAADPDFDLGNDRSPAAAPTDIPHGRCSRDLDRGLRFGRLKGTRLEGERIAARLGVKPWLDATALESRLKACSSPRILHLATHGFFLADQKRDPNKEFRDLGALPGQESGGLGRLSGSGLENPLLRSGLALAGANTWLQNGNPPAEAEDGLLTAEDVSGLDLLDTDLVVLSACETGLGEVHVGEGVFGLRRAFVLAGAKTLVMSLWKVPDQQTQELMEDFYRRLLEEGQPRAEALRQAQLAIKARYPNPLYWGAFICQGDPGPLPLQPKATS